MGISEGVITKVNEIGAEPERGNVPPDSPSSPEKRDHQKLWNWLLGFVLSCLPVLLGPFINLLFKEPWHNVFWSVAVDVSIIYIGVSLIVSAMNDLGPKEQGRRNFYIGMLVLASAVYAAIKAAQQLAAPDAINRYLIAAVNGLLLAAPLVCGVQQYLRKEGGVKQ